MRSSRLPVVGPIAFGLVLAACSPDMAKPPRPPGNPITVGAILSLSGSQATGGQMAKEGLLFCQDWINGKGGINLHGLGHPLTIDIADDQSRPSIAAALTEQLISTQHTLLLGPSNDATTARAAPVAEQHQIPMVSGGASSDAVFNNHYHYLFSVLAPDSQELQGVIDMALSLNPRPQSVAILFASDSLSTEVANATSNYAQAKGMSVVYGGSFTAGVNNLSGQLGAAAGAGPDLILEVARPEDTVRTVQEARQMNIQPKLLAFTNGPGNGAFLSDLHKAANFSVGTTQWAPGTRNPISYFLDSFHYALAYQAQFGHLPDDHAAAATAACLSLEVAIEQAKSAEPRLVHDALAALDLRTFFGEIKFDDRGVNIAKPVYVEQVQSGHTVLIWPRDVAGAAPRYPDPGWAKR